MARINETIRRNIDGYVVKVENDGTKSFSEQTTGLEELDKFLKEQIDQGIRHGMMPYNNFESSIKWEVLSYEAEQIQNIIDAAREDGEFLPTVKFKFNYVATNQLTLTVEQLIEIQKIL